MFKAYLKKFISGKNSNFICLYNLAKISKNCYGG